jgi:hypothetical protein
MRPEFLQHRQHVLDETRISRFQVDQNHSSDRRVPRVATP